MIRTLILSCIAAGLLIGAALAEHGKQDPHAAAHAKAKVAVHHRHAKKSPHTVKPKKKAKAKAVKHEPQAPPKMTFKYMESKIDPHKEAPLPGKKTGK